MPRRSRGCAACRQRRIGCDGKLPACSQCLVTNRHCSGALQGAIIINQTDAITSKHKTEARRPNRSTRVIRQPSSSAFSALCFISEFISFITARNERLKNSSWLSEIQRSSVAGGGMAVDLSMQATALAYCGMATKNPAAVREACNIYGRALSRHSGTISQHAGPPKAATIATSVILSFFEAICSTNSKGYTTHLSAARKMLDLVQEGSDHHEMVWKLAKHVQCQTLFVMVASPFDFLAIPPANRPVIKMCCSQHEGVEETVERLIAHTFHLANILAHKTCGIDDPGVSCEPDIATKIEALWEGYQQDAAQCGRRLEWDCEGRTHYRDAFTAMTVAYFSASFILLNILHLQTPGSEQGIIQNSCETILRCSAFLMYKNIGCACLRMFFPITLVALHSPIDEQRTAAFAYIQGWLQDSAFAGLSSIATQRIRYINPQPVSKDLAWAKKTYNFIY